jgi:hypothetical protein
VCSRTPTSFATNPLAPLVTASTISSRSARRCAEDASCSCRRSVLRYAFHLRAAPSLAHKALAQAAPRSTDRGVSAAMAYHRAFAYEYIASERCRACMRKPRKAASTLAHRRQRRPACMRDTSREISVAEPTMGVVSRTIDCRWDTRLRALDPGVVLLPHGRALRWTRARSDNSLYQESGLAGVFPAFRAICARSASASNANLATRAKLAVDLFRLSLCRQLESLCRAALRGLMRWCVHRLIGERFTRRQYGQRVCDRLAWLGISVDGTPTRKVAAN